MRMLRIFFLTLTALMVLVFSVSANVHRVDTIKADHARALYAAMGIAADTGDWCGGGADHADCPFCKEICTPQIVRLAILTDAIFTLDRDIVAAALFNRQRPISDARPRAPPVAAV